MSSEIEVIVLIGIEKCIYRYAFLGKYVYRLEQICTYVTEEKHLKFIFYFYSFIDRHLTAISPDVK